MKRLALIFAALALTGCASGKFDNRPVTTLQCDRAFALSLYGPFGLSTEFNKADAEALCRAREARNAP